MKQLYRQGDVLLTPIAKLPKGKKRENATVAYGEVTGHSHAVAVEDREAVEVLECGGDLFVHVAAGISEESNTAFLLREPQLKSQFLEFYGTEQEWPSYWAFLLEQRQLGAKALLHEEHLPITLPPGSYQITIQREYSPEAIRNVAD